MIFYPYKMPAETPDSVETETRTGTVTTMSTEYLPYEVAKRQVDEFANKSGIDELLHLHDDAMECRDCEELLDFGIKAISFIRMAHDVLVEAGRMGISPVQQHVVDAIYFLYEAWLKPCEKVEFWLQNLRKKYHEPNNLGKFREAEDFARKAVASNAICRASDDPMFDGSLSMANPPMPPLSSVQIQISRLTER